MGRILLGAGVARLVARLLALGVVVAFAGGWLGELGAARNSGLVYSTCGPSPFVWCQIRDVDNPFFHEACLGGPDCNTCCRAPEFRCIRPGGGQYLDDHGNPEYVECEEPCYMCTHRYTPTGWVHAWTGPCGGTTILSDSTYCAVCDDPAECMRVDKGGEPSELEGPCPEECSAPSR